MFTLWSVIYTGYLVDNQVSEQVAAVSFPLAVTSNFCEAKGDFPTDKTQLNKNNKTSYYWYYYSFTLWLVIKSLSCKAEELYKISTKKHKKSSNSTSLLKSVKSQDVLATAHVFFSLVCLLFFINFFWFLFSLFNDCKQTKWQLTFSLVNIANSSTYWALTCCSVSYSSKSFSSSSLWDKLE